MAYVNVAEWSPEHVAEWLKGLEYSLLPYVHFFLNNEIDGMHLLNLTADDLEDLHIFKIGHQQLILEAVELLRQLHYSLTSETLQSLAVKLGCKARSLYNDLKLNGPQDHTQHVRQERISTSILSAVSEVLTSVKALVSWLDRLPFQRDPLCIKLKKSALKLSIELASTTQRDQFAERPHSLIKRNSLHLAELCDKFIQDSKDSLILQPASLDIAMIKKKPDEELGIHIKSTYSGVHIIGGIKDQSPAKRCNKVEKGDEIIQVNYQTVIGWQQKKLVTAMTEHSAELHLTIKKRPRHVNILGEVIILRPYRIPSKKTVNKCHKWSEDNQLRGQDTCSTSNESECMRDEFNDDEDDSAFLPPDASANHLLLAKEIPLHRLLPGASPVAVQRRATVSGASPTVSKPPVNIEDLVNGVPRIKNSDTFGRSISHDPSCQPLSTVDIFDSLNDSKSETGNENGFSEKECDDDDVKENNRRLCKTSSNTSTSESAVLSVGDEFHEAEKNSFPVVEVLPVQEEEYTVLENKSLSKVDDCIIVKNDPCMEFSKSKSQSICGEVQTINANSMNCTSGCSTSSASSLTVQSNITEVPTDKHNMILYNWEGADTAFRGRRPSAHDISNEIAGSNASDINPVYLRKASKLPTSPPSQEISKENEEMSSYQIVIVGGVPQRCPPSVKERKDKSYSYRKKDSSIRKFGTRHISCKDLGKGDCEGYLYKQREKKGFFPSSHQWVKRWIVLKNNFLYIYRDINDYKAECLISLPGAHVSQAFDCKTKKYAFKVCQQRAKIYFASESLEDLVKWMNKMGLAAISYDDKADIVSSGFAKPGVVLGVANNFYSETDDSESESLAVIRKAENVVEMSTSSSSSELSFDHCLKVDKKAKILGTSNSRNSSVTVYPKVKSQYLNNKEYVSNWIKRKTQTISEVRQNTKCTLGLSPAVETYSSSRGNFVEPSDPKISCNRSFSCTETTYCHFKSDPNNLVKKMSSESSVGSQSVPLSHAVSNKTKYPEQVWNSVDEEYDMLTSSLGRQQKLLAKEITPGLVARMAVSYSNLTQKNTSSRQIKKINYHKGVPAPGYVAKISDSFDHLAKVGNTASFDNKGRKLQHTSSAVSEGVCEVQSVNYKRSASESQVSKRVTDANRQTESLNATFSTESCTASIKKEKKEPYTERFVSLLDKEYNKVFEGKKVSQHQLKSHAKSNSIQSGSVRTEMRFFPSSSTSEITGFTQNSNSNSIHYEKDLLKLSSDSLKNAANFKAWYDDSKNNHVFSNEPPHPPSYEVKSYKKNLSSASHGGHMYYKHLDSSEGIENIGFSCVDQMSNDSFGSNVSASSKEGEERQKQVHNSTDTCSVEVTTANLNVPPEISTEPSSPKGTSFKFFNSPKFMKKLTSPKLDKKNIFKSKKQAKEKKAEQKEVSQLQNDKKFFGSPRLVRAIFGSPKSQKKITVSSAVQTDQISFSELTSEHKKSFHDLNRNDSFVTVLDFPENINPIIESHEQEAAISKSSSNSSLNSNISNSLSPFTSSLYYVEARIKPQIMISLPLVTDKENESRVSPPETPRTPLKPTMGVAMLSKKRLPSISGESCVSVSSSKSSHDGSIKEGTSLRSEVSLDINGDTQLQALESLQKASISSENADLRMHVSK